MDVACACAGRLYPIYAKATARRMMKERRDMETAQILVESLAATESIKKGSRSRATPKRRPSITRWNTWTSQQMLGQSGKAAKSKTTASMKECQAVNELRRHA